MKQPTTRTSALNLTLENKIQRYIIIDASVIDGQINWKTLLTP